MIRTHMLLFLFLSGLLAGGCGSKSGLSDLQQGMTAFNQKNYAAAIPCFNRAAKRAQQSRSVILLIQRDQMTLYVAFPLR